MKIEYLKIEDLKVYDNNPRKNDAAVGSVMASIKEFGFKVPIVVDKDNVIVAGHTRLKAAKKMDMKEVPCIVADDLSPVQVKAFRLADNKTGEMAEWDFEKLEIELKELEEEMQELSMLDFGFDMKKFEAEEDGDEKIIEDEVPKLPKEIKTKQGDIYQLGKHRLMCGSATKADDVEKLMGGERADICFTSPPYNLGRGNDYKKMPNRAMKNSSAYNGFSDDLSDEEYSRLLCDSLQNALNVCDDVLYNISFLSGSKQGILELLSKFREFFADLIIWEKDTSLPCGTPSQRGMLSHRCEPIFAFNKKGTRNFSHPQWERGTAINVIKTVNARNNTYANQHAATFPVEFAFEIIKNFTEHSVLDLYGGTGTTLIAAERLNRVCYMMEIDPLYVDLIIERWETYTGQKAEKIESAL